MVYTFISASLPFNGGESDCWKYSQYQIYLKEICFIVLLCGGHAKLIAMQFETMMLDIFL